MNENKSDRKNRNSVSEGKRQGERDGNTERVYVGSRREGKSQ